MNSFDVLKSINRENKEKTLKIISTKKHSPFRIIKFLFKKYLHYVWKRNRILEQSKDKSTPKDNPYKDYNDAQYNESIRYIENIAKFFKNTFRIIFKGLLWLVPLFLCIFFYIGEDNNNVPLFIVFGAYIFWTLISIQSKKDIKYWSSLASYDDLYGKFYKRFVTFYNPTNFRISLFLAIFLPVNFLTTIQYISLFSLICISDLLYRRYLTLNLKLDLLLEAEQQKINLYSD